MPLETDTSNWSGEGVFTQLLIERLGEIDAVRFVKIEYAPATRSELAHCDRAGHDAGRACDGSDRAGRCR